MRAWPAPREPNPSPGATATRASSRIRSAVTPSGSRSQAKNVPSERAPGSAATHAVAPRFVDRAPLLDRVLRAEQRRDRRLLERREDPGPQMRLHQRRAGCTSSAFPTAKPSRQPAIP